MATEAETEQRRRAAAAAIAGGALVVAGGSEDESKMPAAAARAKAAGLILAGVVAFLAAQRARMRSWLTETMRRRTPTVGMDDIERVIAGEEERQAEFERRQTERFARDLTTVLAIPDATLRERAIRGLTEREERYARQRDEAVAARAFAAIDRVVLRRQSPTGAFWRLDPGVREHTAGCLLMGGKFWPWQVLDRVHPPRHSGCPCRLIGYGAAIAEGLLAPGAVVDVQTAIRRAAHVIMEGVLIVEPAEGEALIEAAGGEELLRLRAALLEAGLVADEAALDALLEFDPEQPRWPKGHPRAGQWRPKLAAGGGLGTKTKKPKGLAKDLDELRALAAPQKLGVRWNDETRQDEPVIERRKDTAALEQVGASVAKIAERYGTWHADRVRIEALHEERKTLTDRHSARVAAAGGYRSFFDREEYDARREGREVESGAAFAAMEALRPDDEKARFLAIDAEIGRLLKQEARGKREALVAVLAELRPMGGAVRVGSVKVGDGDKASLDASLAEVARLLPADWLRDSNAGATDFQLLDRRAWHLLDGSGGMSEGAARARQERRIEALLDEGAVFVGYTAAGLPVVRVPVGSKQHWRKDLVFTPDAAGLYELSANGVPEALADDAKVRKGERKLWRPGSTIRVAAGDTSTLLHELGHRIEQVYGQQDNSGYRPILRATITFLRERAAGAETVKLSDLRPGAGYEDNERTWEDEFVDPYIGKDYGGRTTEVLTMGLQMLFYPTYNRTLTPAKHNTGAKRDEAMRHFLLGMMAAL